MKRRWLAVLLIAVLLVVSLLLGVVFFWLPLVPLPHEMVCQLTGEAALNDTTVVDVHGTDIGIMVHHGGRLRFVFGDTFGLGGLGGSNWRSNTMAYTLDSDPSDGITLSGWVINDSTGYAKELISSLKEDNVEMTAIPTAAYSNGACLYIYYMSVRHWGDGGEWACNNASIAYSHDGETFFKATNISWPGTSNFIEFGLITGDDTAPSTGGILYFLATGSGRYHHAYLTRVPETQLLNQSSYTYFTGIGTDGFPTWSHNHAEAQPVIKAPMGEISVMWNPYLSKYVVMNLDDVNSQIVLRTANVPWGPWSQPRVVIARPEFGGCYAPNIHPLLVEGSGRIVYFTMSLWVEYNVYLMKVDLTQHWGLSSCMEQMIMKSLTIYWIFGEALRVKIMNIC